MKTALEKDLENISKDWFDEDTPIGVFAIIIFAGLMTFLMAITYEWKSFSFLEGFQNVILLLGFAVYLGRQLFDISWIYLVLSYKERYQTKAEKQRIAIDSTKHVVRTIYLVALVPVLYFFNDDIHLLWSIPVFISFFLVPLIYYVLANKQRKKVEEQLKKTPLQRVSADGKVDLSHLPFVYENLEEHGITNEKVKNAYVKIQSLLDYVTIRVSLIDDVENVHTLKRMGEEELPRLLNDYEALDGTLQQEYVAKMLTYLELIEQKLLTYKTMIDEKKTQNIQTTFNLLDERYR